MEDNHIIAIYNRNQSIALTEFDKFMSKTNKYMNELAVKEMRYKECEGKKLEMEVLEAMKKSCLDTPFHENDIDLVSGQRFPDIVAGKHFGVEVKSTKSNSWESTGSSIIESTRVKDVEYIYMLFGKLGGNPVEFRCKPYQECLSDITVTHSPRYKINMDIAPDSTIFSKMKTDYDTFRLSENPIDLTRKYYLDKAEKEGKTQMPWWLSQEVSVPPTLTLWVKDTFTKEQEKLYRALLLMLFPFDICNSDYKRPALWLCTRMGVLKSNFRDLYTAGGRVLIYEMECPKIIAWILNLAPMIKQLLDSGDWTFDLNDYNKDLLDASRPFETWVEQITKQYPNITQLRDWLMLSVEK